MKRYSLKKCRQVLHRIYHLFQKRKSTLPPDTAFRLRAALLLAQEEILSKDKEGARKAVGALEEIAASALKRTPLVRLKDLTLSLGVALLIAVLVRQMWFEFYEIPSGSMRPTLKEQDRLAVSKTSFGINIPLTPREFYFDPDLVQRGGIVIFTGEDMDIRDVDTLYFYLFPGKKQYVKRLIGKPGDTLYFYGGEMFGLDKEGRDISSELNLPRLAQIDHIPFIDFERKVVVPPQPINGVYSPAFLYQMNEPVAKLTVSPSQRITGEMMPLKAVHDPNAPAVSQYSALWGFHNFATARLLTAPEGSQTPLYLELKHHPNFEGAKLVRDEMGRVRPSIGVNTTLLPMDQEHLNRILDHLYTARFCVKGGKAYRQGVNRAKALPFLPDLPGVPDGCYEFYEGQAYEVLWQGITKKLSRTHPLYRQDPAQIQLLFNLGMEWDIRFSPSAQQYRLTPARYAYYRQGDLYLLGAPIFLKSEEELQQFVKEEQQKSSRAYTPFVDAGPPFNAEGELNRDLIHQNGLLIPKGMYLVLGDNHAMSADSREFGFVPQSNLRGAPDLIFWPPGDRLGHPNQSPYPFFNIPRTIVWILAGLCITGGSLYWRRRHTLPLKLDA